MINNIKRGIRNWLNSDTYNKFNDAFVYQLGANSTTYDTNGETYLDKAYNLNSVVYSVINQQAIKTSTIP